MSKHLLFIAGSDIDYFYEIENFPMPGEAAISKYIESKVGGCVLNAASVASMLGSNTKVLDILNSEDEGTELILNALKNNNVDVSEIELNKDAINGKCIIMKKDDEKIIFVIDPKKEKYDVNKIKNVLDNSSYIYSLATILKSSFSDLNILNELRNNGTKIILDASGQYTKKEDADVLLNYADGFFMNESSLEKLSNRLGYNPVDELLNKGLEFACVTNGGKGVTCYTKDGIYKQDALKVNVIDSTGAGDSFAGSFLHFYSNNYSINECLKYANASGAYACSKVGGMSGAIKQEELFKFMEEKQ